MAELARAAGVSPHTVRFYERCGLLPPPPREYPSGYRRYPPEALERLRLIRLLKALGFSLRDAGKVLAAGGDPESCKAVRAVAEVRLFQLRRELELKARAVKALERVVEACLRNEDPSCHLFSLAAEAPLVAGLERAPAGTRGSG